MIKKGDNKLVWILPSLFLLVFALIFSTNLVFAAEPGDDFDTAGKLEVPGDFSGELTESNDEDFYKISLDPGSIVEFEFTPDSEDGQKLEFYNPSGDRVFYKDVDGGVTETESYALESDAEAGYWFVGVSGPSGWDYDGGYMLNVSIEGEPEPEFEFSNFRVEPGEVYEGEEVELNIDVSNVGEASGEYTAEFFIDDESVGSDTVTVASGETETASVSLVEDTEGTYTIQTEDQVTELVVKKESGLPWMLII
ncbi:MAG: CARDB domain-containing protein [Candidatus Hadarchaeia archaeon]